MFNIQRLGGASRAPVGLSAEPPKTASEPPSGQSLDEMVLSAEREPALLKPQQIYLQQLKADNDPQIGSQHRFREQDHEFLVHGEGDPAEFLESRFPELKPLMTTSIAGRGDMTGVRLGNRRNGLRQSFQFFEPTLRRTDLPDVPGVRIKPLLRLVGLLYYAGRFTSEAKLREDLQKAGYPLKKRSEDAATIFTSVARQLRFSEHEQRVGRELLQEVPFTGNPSSVPYHLVDPTSNCAALDSDAADRLRERATKMGIEPAALYQIGTVLHALQRGLTPIDLRGMEWQEEGWKPAGDLEKFGLKKVRQLIANPPVLGTSFLEQLAQVGNRLDQLQDERRVHSLTPAARPLFDGTELQPEGVVLCHGARGLPLQGKLRPNSDFSSGGPLTRNPRGLVEFSWNGVIDQWSDAPVAVLIPLQKMAPEKLENLWYTATSHLGELEIPAGSHLLVRQDMEIPASELELWKARGITLGRFPVDRPTSEASSAALSEMGYQPMLLATSFEGGLGTDTTWLDTNRMVDHFHAAGVQSSTAATQRMAGRLGVKESAGTDSYPLGRLTLRMESLFRRIKKRGYFHDGWTRVPKWQESIETFAADLKELQQTQRGPAWEKKKECALAYLDGLRWEMELFKTDGEYIFERLDQEFSTGRSGPASEQVLRSLNQTYGTAFEPAQLTSAADLLKLREEAYRLGRQKG